MWYHANLDIEGRGIAIVYDSCIQNDTMQNKCTVDVDIVG